MGNRHGVRWLKKLSAKINKIKWEAWESNPRPPCSERSERKVKDIKCEACGSNPRPQGWKGECAN